MTAEFEAAFLAARPELASRYVFIDVVAEAAVAVGRPARAAEQAAGTIDERFHVTSFPGKRPGRLDYPQRNLTQAPWKSARR